MEMEAEKRKYSTFISFTQSFTKSFELFEHLDLLHFNFLWKQ